ncbi:hypothetical protein Aperf_G00000020128 [Anoplocephala perfoliata]
MAKKKSIRKGIADQGDLHSDSEDGNIYESFNGQTSLFERLNKCIDDLTSSRPDARIRHLLSIQEIFRVNYLALSELKEEWNYRESLISSLESSMKRGKTAEQVETLRCLSIFSSQLSCSDNRELSERFHPFMESMLCDPTKSSQFRGACATSISWLHYLSEPVDYPFVKRLMENLANIFKNASLRGDGMAPDFPKADVEFHRDCLYAWGLLYTSLYSSDADRIGQEIIGTLVSILQSKYMVVRMAASDVVGLVYERIRDETRESFKGSYYEALVQVLDRLSNDSDKHTSKADSKKQRSTFRDLLRFLRTRVPPSEEIKLSFENLDLDTYQKLFIYQSFCRLLTLGMSIHLQENMLLRNTFSMGPPIQPIPQSQRVRLNNKKIRNLENQQISKNRTQYKNSTRDKRAVVINEEC